MSDTIDLTSERYLRDPYESWARLRDAGAYRDPSTGWWYLARYEDVQRAMQDASALSNAAYGPTVGRVVGRSVIQMDGGEHLRNRRVIAPELVGKRLAARSEIVAERIESLLSPLRDMGRFDLVHYTSRLPISVIAEFLGFPADDEHLFHRWYQQMIAGLAGDADELRLGRAARAELEEYVAPVLTAHRECPSNPSNSIWGRLVGEADDERCLTDEEIATIIGVLLIGGGETTASTMANMWWNVLQNATLLDQLRADPELWHAVFNETLRHSAPQVLQPRVTTEEYEVAGVTIPRGAPVLVTIAAANRDETAFADPAEFDPYRLHLDKLIQPRTGGDTAKAVGSAASRGHLSFGAGKHYCLGYQLARLEAVEGCRRLLDMFDDIAMDGSPPPMITRSTNFRTVKKLPVKVARGAPVPNAGRRPVVVAPDQREGRVIR